jgi:hypothetical protein
MKSFLACAMVFALLAACAPKPQPVTAQAWQAAPGPEYEAALHALIDCGLRQIARLDDGRSDAGIVARAAAARCDREKTGFQVAAMNRAATPRTALAVNTAIDDATNSTFAAIVLEVRAYRREHGRRAAPPAPSRRSLDAVAM